MTVYVDDMGRGPYFGREVAPWSHMVADHPAELAAFAVRLGLDPQELQDAGQPSEHYVIDEAMRIRALELGAMPMTYATELGPFIAAKRQQMTADSNTARENDR